MQPNQGIKAWQWIVTVIVVIILIVLGYYLFRGGKAGNIYEPEDSNNTVTETPNTELNRILVSDQYPGNVVFISSVQLANPGWVEIHKDNNGTPGAIIGSQYFEKGTFNGKITLTENTVDGQLYYAMIHSDDGDKKFDGTKDLPLKDAQGNVVMKPFRVTSDVEQIKA